MKTRTVLGLFLLALTGAWAIDALVLQPAATAAWPGCCASRRCT
ncbi:hypothetical protein WJ969_16605 [Achromobacter xylosoxidans]